VTSSDQEASLCHVHRKLQSFPQKTQKQRDRQSKKKGRCIQTNSSSVFSIGGQGLGMKKGVGGSQG